MYRSWFCVAGRELKGRTGDALSDFTEAARIQPDNAEAHSGAGYERALLKALPEAQRQNALADGGAAGISIGAVQNQCAARSAASANFRQAA